MPRHGTPFFSKEDAGLYQKVLEQILHATPVALDGLNLAMVVDGLTNRTEALGRELHQTLVRFVQLKPYPADGVEFELTFDFGAPEADPMQMVRTDGYDPKGWKYTGRKQSGVQTRAFKLVHIVYCCNLDEVRQRQMLAQYGPVPGGQWRGAFKAAFPKPDGNGPIGFADPSWVHPNGRVFFPFISSGGGSNFRWADFELDKSWRWLVPASPADKPASK